MLINGTEVNISNMTVEDANRLSALTNLDIPIEGDSVLYKTDETIDIVGFKFKPAYEFKIIDDELSLNCIYLYPENSGDKVLEDIHNWKDKMCEEYDCEVIDDSYVQPDYYGRLGYEDDEDYWTIKISTNAFNYDYEVCIIIE